MALNAAGLRLQLCAAATNTDTMNSRGRKINDLQKWRRGWDSNPRYGFPYARFRGEYFQPLSHLSAVVAGLIVAERCVVRQSRGGPFANALRRANLSCKMIMDGGASRKSRRALAKRGV